MAVTNLVKDQETDHSRYGPIDNLLSTSTVLDLSFVYVQWRQAFRLFPMIEAGERVASQAFFAFVPQT